MIPRRSFLAALGLAPGVARSYFFIGESWAKHESGIYIYGFDEYEQSLLNALRLQHYMIEHIMKPHDSAWPLAFSDPTVYVDAWTPREVPPLVFR